MSDILELRGDVAPWHALINEAEQHAGVQLDEELESYLVFTLMRYLREPAMTQRVLALEFLEALQQRAHRRDASLRDVADQCLLFSGLFPRRAERRRVRVSYYVDLGRSAYRNLATNLTALARLFGRMAEEFVPAMDTLQAIRAVAGESSGMTMLQAWELWQDTASQQAWAEIQRQTGAHPAPARDDDEAARH